MLLKSGMSLLAKESIGGPEGSISGHGEDEGAVSAFSQAVAALASVRESSLPPVLEKSEKREKLVSMLSQLLGQAVIMLVSATHEVSSSVSELGSILPAIVDVLEGRTKKKKQLESKKSNKSKKSKKEADEVLEVEESEGDERQVELLSSLLDICLELLSYTGENNVTAKGIRDAVRRVWGAVGRDLSVSLDLLESVVEAVIADDVEDDDDEDDEDEEAIEKDNGDNSEDDEDVEVKGNGKGEGRKRKREKLGGPKPRVRMMRMRMRRMRMGMRTEAEAEDDNEDQDKDVVIAPTDALDLLANEESDSDEELERLKGMVEHGPEADAALVNMLEQRRQGRKAGLLMAKRKQCVIRSRALDILESLLNRVDSAELLVPIFPPLLVCVRKLQTGLIQNLHEGRAFEERLRTYIEGKFCKKRFSLIGEGDEEVEEGVFGVDPGPLCFPIC